MRVDECRSLLQFGQTRRGEHILLLLFFLSPIFLASARADLGSVPDEVDE